jgi:DNA-binding transcriptional MerR regulator
MGVLEQISDLKRRGIPEPEIINSLRSQGISPKAINDALSQSRIKNAVSSENIEEIQGNEEMEPSILRPERAEQLPTEGYLSDEDLTPPAPSHYGYNAMMVHPGPVTKEISEEEYIPKPGQAQGGYSSPYQYQQQYPQEGYEYSEGQAPYDSSEGFSDTDTLIEISEQVFSEKIKPLQRQIEDLNEFKALSQTKLENVSERLKRIESSIDRLQSAILEKVGDYGRGLDNVKKEMEMMQDSFSKVVNVIADASERKHHTGHKTESHTPDHTSHKIHKTTHVVHHKSNSHGTKKHSRKK